MVRLISDDVWGALTTWLEARGEPPQGQTAVGRVIRNRIRLGWGYDVVGVILAPYQFSCWNTDNHGRIAAARLADDDSSYAACLDAWMQSETDDAGVGDAVFYYNPSIVTTPPRWATAERFVVTIGHHSFYHQ